MQTSIGAAQSREYHSITAIDGYVHKFRREACDDVRATLASFDSNPIAAKITTPADPSVSPGPSVSLGWLLGKFALVAVALSGLAAAGARALQ